MSNMGDSTSTYSTYGQQQQAPMPPGMQPGYQQPVQHRGGSKVSRPGWATSELIAYVLTVLGVLLASAIIGDPDGRGARSDGFGADEAWTLITVLTFGYMLAKGIAKAGKSNGVYDENSRY